MRLLSYPIRFSFHLHRPRDVEVYGVIQHKTRNANHRRTEREVLVNTREWRCLLIDRSVGKQSTEREPGGTGFKP